MVSAIGVIKFDEFMGGDSSNGFLDICIEWIEAQERHEIEIKICEAL